MRWSKYIFVCFLWFAVELSFYLLLVIISLITLTTNSLIWNFRLKLGNEFQYQLNPQGSSPAEVLGINYKKTLKPTLASFEDEMKKSSMGKMEELIYLQQQSSEKAMKLESKRNRLATLQAHIDDVSLASILSHYRIGHWSSLSLSHTHTIFNFV